MDNYRNVLLVSEKTLKSRSLINNNVDGALIYPAIQIFQELDLENAIGPVLLHKLQDLVGTGKINNQPDYKTLLDDYITPYMVWGVMSAIQVSLNYKFSNSGMIQNQDDKKMAIDYSNGQALAKQYEWYAAGFGQKLKKYLCANSAKFPEYHQCENHQREEEISLCDIFLEDIPHKKSYIGK